MKSGKLSFISLIYTVTGAKLYLALCGTVSLAMSVKFITRMKSLNISDSTTIFL